jgi:hypothetical protein
VKMIQEDIIVRDELAAGTMLVGCISQRSQFEFAGRIMILLVDCCSGALAADSPRMTPAYEDCNARRNSAAVSSDSGSSIQACHLHLSCNEHSTCVIACQKLLFIARELQFFTSTPRSIAKVPFQTMSGDVCGQPKKREANTEVEI